MPENYVHGVPQFYATAMPERNGAQPLLVKSLDGRPLKIEGNPLHPLGLVGTDRYAQASILDLYDVDRAARFLKGREPVSRDVAFDHLAAVARQLPTTKGEGVCFLMGQSSSPSRRRIQAQISEAFPQVRWFWHEPVDFSRHREAAAQAQETSRAGQPGRPLRPHPFLPARPGQGDCFPGLRFPGVGRKQ